jgi:hypothetical protein
VAVGLAAVAGGHAHALLLAAGVGMAEALRARERHADYRAQWGDAYPQVDSTLLKPACPAEHLLCRPARKTLSLSLFTRRGAAR